MSFLQNEQEDDDGDFGVNLLTNLWTEAQAQLDVAQKTETHAAHNFALLKQSLGVQKRWMRQMRRDELSAELSSAKSDLVETEKSLKVLQEPMVASDLSCAKAIREELPS